MLSGRHSIFFLSARPILWPAITVNTLAFSYMLRSDIFVSIIISLDLCVIAAFGFLLNDIVDRKIDEKNRIPRWTLESRLDLYLFLGAGVAVFGAVVFSYYYLGLFLFAELIVTLLMIIAYSLLLKRVIFLGNLVAAVLSVTPGLLLFLDSHWSTLGWRSSEAPTAQLLIVGFFLLLSREIRFDEFDRAGDAVGGRLTLPMVFSPRVLRVIHLTLITGSMVLLLCTLTVDARHSVWVNAAIGLVTVGCAASFLFVGYRSQTRADFSRITRFVMAVVPVSILLSF